MSPVALVSPRALLLLTVLTWAAVTTANSMPSPDKERVYQTDLDLIEDDGTLENALINYLFARQMVNRLKNQVDVTDLQRKRSYWRQCAFNAVSCFGK